jgi:hypothetical protein
MAVFKKTLPIIGDFPLHVRRSTDDSWRDAHERWKTSCNTQRHCVPRNNVPTFHRDKLLPSSELTQLTWWVIINFCSYRFVSDVTRPATVVTLPFPWSSPVTGFWWLQQKLVCEWRHKPSFCPASRTSFPRRHNGNVRHLTTVPPDGSSLIVWINV